MDDFLQAAHEAPSPEGRVRVACDAVGVSPRLTLAEASAEPRGCGDSRVLPRYPTRRADIAQARGESSLSDSDLHCPLGLSAQAAVAEYHRRGAEVTGYFLSYEGSCQPAP